MRCLDRYIFIHAVDCFRPGEVPDSGALVTVLSMSGVKTDGETKRTYALMLIDKRDRTVSCEFTFVTERAIRLRF